MKNILITGASSGIGLSLAKHFSSEFRVLACARRVETMRKEFGSDANVVVTELDLEDFSMIATVFSKLESDYGPIPYLINNAGRMDAVPNAELTTETLMRAMRVNCFGPIELMRLSLRGMRERNFGRIVNLTSGAPLNCFPNYGAYSSSKAALNALTVTTAKENQEYDIKINLMSPGPCRTEMNPNSDLAPEVCHPTADYLVQLPATGPTGGFFWLGHRVPLFPDLTGVDWLKGVPAPSMERVL